MTKFNNQRDPSWVNDVKIRKSISDGVKFHYKNNPDAVQKRLEKKQITLLQKKDRCYDRVKYVVSGIECASFGEKVFVQWMIKAGHKIERCFIRIPYKNKLNQERVYNPDFIIDNNLIVEIKCELLKNFESSIVRFFSTYDRENLQLKIDAVNNFCQQNNFKFKLYTFDDDDFRLLYHREKRKRQKNKRYENKVKENNSL